MKRTKRFLIIFYIGLFSFLLLSKLLPHNKPINRTIRIYSSDKSLIYEEYNSNKASYIPLSEINDKIVETVLLVEDQNFYSHSGFDFKSILRAATKNILSLSLKEGASSITQQYARMLYLSNEKTLKRKIKEVDYTIMLEKTLSKEEILEGYLNTIYFGHQIYGIKRASLFFFNKNQEELDYNEISILIGIIKGPEIYSPIKNYENSIKRKNIILTILHNKKKIDDEEYEYYINKNPIIYGIHNEESSAVSYYVDTVKNELSELNIESNNINVHTYLDYEFSLYLDKIVREHINDEQVGIVAVEPNTGYIKAIVGGSEYIDSPYNRATKSKRQIGSTVKPFLYYNALESGFSPTTTFLSAKTTMYVDDLVYSPSNYNNLYENKRITLAYALATSDNIYATKAHLFIGMNKLSNTLNKLDFSLTEPSCTLALGTSETNLLTLTSAYNILASEGRRPISRTIKEVINENGEVIYRNKNLSNQMFDKKTTFILTDLMTGMFDTKLSGQINVTGTSISCMLSKTYAGKSGSTDFDSWMIGYNPLITIGVWTGYDDNSFYSSSASKILWAKAIEYYLRDYPNIWYSPPNGVYEKLVDPSGLNNGYKKCLYFNDQLPR